MRTLMFESHAKALRNLQHIPHFGFRMKITGDLELHALFLFKEDVDLLEECVLTAACQGKNNLQTGMLSRLCWPCMRRGVLLAISFQENPDKIVPGLAGGGPRLVHLVRHQQGTIGPSSAEAAKFLLHRLRRP